MYVERITQMKTLIKWFKELCIKWTVPCPDCHAKFCRCFEDDKCTTCGHDLWDCTCDPPCNLDCKCEKICENCLNEPCDCKHE